MTPLPEIKKQPVAKGADDRVSYGFAAFKMGLNMGRD